MNMRKDLDIFCYFVRMYVWGVSVVDFGGARTTPVEDLQDLDWMSCG